MYSADYTDEAYYDLLRCLSLHFPSFQNNGASAFKPGIERVELFCEILGNPHKSYPCIHVAGTNGKGSTCNITAAVLSSSGLKTGLYTSPHILDFRERMRIVDSGGVTLIPRRQVWNFLKEYGETMERLGLSYFEMTTAMAFWFFAREGVDVAVIETGLGGRLDATNVIVPLISVITNIGLDHTDLLGSTLAEIAGEKAGIIKPGVPVVIGESHPETDPVFENAARVCASPLLFADREEPVAGGRVLDDAAFSELLSTMDLRGLYQRKNLRTSLCAVEVIRKTFDLKRNVILAAIRSAASICAFHGRWEKIADKPVTICDIGHNEHGLKHNFAQLDSLLDSGEYTDLVMVYGSVRDKDFDAVLRLLPRRARIFFTSASGPRAVEAGELKLHADSIAAEQGFVRDVSVASDAVADAVEAAFRHCHDLCRIAEPCRCPANPLLYIGGSTYVVGEAVEYILKCGGIKKTP